VFGGETEGPFGPTIVEVSVYVLQLALIAAGLAHVVRSRFETRGLATWHFPTAALLAVLGTSLTLVGTGAFAGLVAVAPVEMVVSLVLGALSLAAGVLLAIRAQ